MENKYDIFISYSRKNLEQVKKFKKEIESSTNTRCWMDLEGIESGTPKFTKAIIHAINACPIFLFMLSEESQKSENALKELDFAYKKYREEGKKVVIVYIENCKMTDEFCFDYGKADTIDWQDEMQKNKLIRDIRFWKCSISQKSVINSRDHIDKLADQLVDQKLKSIIGGQTKKENMDKEVVSITNRPNKFYLKALHSKSAKFILVALPVIGIIISALFFATKHNPELIEEQIIEYVADTVCCPVDLGLHSGTLWGDRNIGAFSTTVFGDMYAWGEVSLKNDYSQSSYDANSKPTKFLTGKQFDVANAVLGDRWSLPSESQFKELIDECDWCWKKTDGHYGYEIRSKKNGNTIFLPAAGWCCGEAVDHQNEYGYYWTKDRAASNPIFARELLFPKNGKGIVGNGYLFYGRSVRAVMSKEVTSNPPPSVIKR